MVGSFIDPDETGARGDGGGVNLPAFGVRLHQCRSPGPMADSADIAGRDGFVALPGAATQLGFLTVLHEASGYLGGYLVTNVWGRPVEFRLSTAVQPNRVQQILYGGKLQPYICADLIGKTMVDKTSA